MAWVSPITDRTAADIANRTSKAFFNVSDWLRIYGNTQAVNARILAAYGITVPFMTLITPTRSNFPSAAGINGLVQNIENSRLYSGLKEWPSLPALKTDWGEGMGSAAPDYVTVNLWENTLLILYNNVRYAANYQVYSGVAHVGQDRYWQNRWRVKTVPGSGGGI